MTVSRILLATPYAWTVPHPVNEHVAELADALAARHEADPASAPRPVVVAPSSDPAARRATRRAIRELARGSDLDSTLVAPELHAAAPGLRRPHERAHEWPLLAVAPPAGPASVGLRASLRVLLDTNAFDLVHLHDPIANELTRAILRRREGLTLATFHEPPAASVLATIAAPLRERLIGRVDRWLVGSESARERLRDAFGDALDPVIVPTRATRSQLRGGNGSVVVVGRGEGDEAVVRDLVRALAPLMDARPELSLTLLSRWGQHHRPTAPRGVRARVLGVEAPTREQADAVLAGAGAYVDLAASPACTRARDEAAALGVPTLQAPGTSDPHYADAEALQLQVQAALDAAPSVDETLPTSEQLAAVHVDAYETLRERVQVHIAPPTAINDRSCVIDLHMHTSHSWDCATDPEALLYVARQVGLTAVAVTDHNEISGALACAELADEYGIQVIVGEEVKTAQGEVIGLFLSERIEPGLSWHETIERIRAQDGLVYVPHPFDRLHTIPDVNLLRETLDEIDAFETYNARLPFDQYNRDAERFARTYNLIEGAGSDAHVPQGLGTAAVHMPAWDDKESFLLALSQGEILKRPKSLLYLQGLKWVNDLTGRSKRLPEEAVGRE